MFKHTHFPCSVYFWQNFLLTAHIQPVDEIACQLDSIKEECIRVITMTHKTRQRK